MLKGKSGDIGEILIGFLAHTFLLGIISRICLISDKKIVNLESYKIYEPMKQVYLVDSTSAIPNSNSYD